MDRFGGTCLNGAKCTFVRETCDDFNSSFTKPVCDCNAALPEGEVQGSTCFWGQFCQSKVDNCGPDTRSCQLINQIKNAKRDPASLVCATDEWPDKLCSADAPLWVTPGKFNVGMSKAEIQALEQESAGSQSEDAVASSSSSIVAAAIVAAILAMFAVLVFVQQRRQSAMGERDEIDSEFDIHPKAMATNLDEASAIGQLAHFQTGVLPAAVLSERGDKLWMDFRKCASFDGLYYGNAPFQLSDSDMEDIYGVLAVPCPPRSYFLPLRQVGNSFLDQVVGKEGGALTDVSTIDDLADFLVSGMTDTLVERALDLCATLASAGGDYQDEELYEVFYAMIAEYDPDQNQFLASNEGGRCLRDDAANRVLDHKEPIYWEVNQDADEEYTAITDQLTGDTLYDQGDANGGASAEALYDHANPGAGGVEATYAMANSDGAGGEALYAMANSLGSDGPGGEALYAMANSLSSDGPAAGQATYAIASSVLEQAGGGEATYAVADSVSARAGGGEATYAMANSVGLAGGEATYAMADSFSAPAGAGGGEATYAMADSFNAPAGANTAGGIYDIAATDATTSPSRHSQRRSSMGAEPTYGFASSIPLKSEGRSSTAEYQIGSVADVEDDDEGLYGRASAREMPNAYARAASARASVASANILYDAGEAGGVAPTTEVVFDVATKALSSDGSVRRNRSSVGQVNRQESGRSNSYIEACENDDDDEVNDADGGYADVQPFAASTSGASARSIAAFKESKSLRSKTGTIDSLDFENLENDEEFLAFQANYNEGRPSFGNVLDGLEAESVESLPRARQPGAAGETSLLMQNIAGLEDEDADASAEKFKLASSEGIAPRPSLRLDTRGISNESLDL